LIENEGSLYAFGGFKPKSSKPVASILKLHEENWEKINAKLPHKLVGPQILRQVGSQVLILGGKNDTDENTEIVNLDLETGALSTFVAELPKSAVIAEVPR
jgi:N-acetylneuraminic acid mutarotase